MPIKKFTYYWCIIFVSSIVLILFTGVQLTALNSSKYNSYLIVSDTTDVRVNFEMLRMFEDFKERGTISEELYYRLLYDVEIRNVDRWIQVYNEYKEALGMEKDILESEEFRELIRDEEILIAQEDFSGTLNETTDDSAPTADPVFSGTPSAIIKPVENVTSGIVRYHIQIAASRIPLSTSSLRDIYPGSVAHFQEDDWEKYYVGTFNRFSDARSYQNQVRVPGSFIIAYCFNQKLIPYRARRFERLFAEFPLKTFHQERQPQYRIQLVASRSALSKSQLTHIYPDLSKVGVIYEEGWFKYSIPGQPGLYESWEKARKTGVPGVFVVRYKEGEKIPLR